MPVRLDGDLLEGAMPRTKDHTIPAPVGKALLYVAREIARSRMALFAREAVHVDPIVLLFEAYGSNYTREQARSLLRAVVAHGLLERAGRDRYTLRRPAPVDDATLGARLAAELRAKGDHEAFSDVLARTSPAVASCGLWGDDAVERLERLWTSPDVRTDYLMGRPRVYLAA